MYDLNSTLTAFVEEIARTLPQPNLAPYLRAFSLNSSALAYDHRWRELCETYDPDYCYTYLDYPADEAAKLFGVPALTLYPAEELTTAIVTTAIQASYDKMGMEVIDTVLRSETLLPLVDNDLITSLFVSTGSSSWLTLWNKDDDKLLDEYVEEYIEVHNSTPTAILEDRAFVIIDSMSSGPFDTVHDLLEVITRCKRLQMSSELKALVQEVLMLYFTFASTYGTQYQLHNDPAIDTQYKGYLRMYGIDLLDRDTYDSEMHTVVLDAVLAHQHSTGFTSLQTNAIITQTEGE